MFYVIKKGTKLFDELSALMEKVQEVKEKAIALMVEFGGTKNYYTRGRYLAGGIEAVEFKGKLPEGWRPVDKSFKNLGLPKVSQKKEWEKINALPKMEYDELNVLVGFKAGFYGLNGGLCHVKSVGLNMGKDEILIDVHHYDGYEPKKGMIELKESEYRKLKTKLENEEEQSAKDNA